MSRVHYLGTVVILVSCAWFYQAILAGLPSAQDILEGAPAQSTLLLDRNGKTLYRIFTDEDRTNIALETIPQHLIDALLAVEDNDFFDHHGFSLSGILRAARANLSGAQTLQGGSTLTQQLAKNRALTGEKTLTRKLKELVLAISLERITSKKEILEMYLNEVAFGGTAYGIEAAAHYYFGKPASELDLAESAFLVGILRAPSRYSPFVAGGTEYLYRKRLVLAQMLNKGYINAQRHENALNTPLQFAPQRYTIEAPHFVFYVRGLLFQRYGKDAIERGGLVVTTSLDLELQKTVQGHVTGFVDRMFRYWVGNGAALVTDPATGEILSMVGSADYFDTDNEGQVNVTLSLRQPGSTIKPMTYAMSLQAGKTAASMLSDKPIALTIPDEGDYTPRNIDYEYQGTITLRRALAGSRNIPAVNELVQLGVRPYIEKAKRLGINGWDNHNDFRYALTLGSGEVRMLDLAQMFSTFPNSGYPVAPDPIISITGPGDETLLRRDCALSANDCRTTAEFSPGVAFLINDILSDNTSRSGTFGDNSNLYIKDHKVAAKSGTTDLLRDNWTVGYTSDHLVIVWIGNNSGASMRFVESASRGASTPWKQIMNDLLADRPSHRFEIPEDIIQGEACIQPDWDPCEPCKRTRLEYFVRGTAPAPQCPEDLAEKTLAAQTPASMVGQTLSRVGHP